jgi:hypothetical protein
MLKQIICVAVLLAGCGDKPVPNRVEKKQARIEAAKIIVSKTPQPHTYDFDGNQLVVVGIPAADEAGFVDVQTCYVWRDESYKTASISCPSDQTSPVVLPGGPTFDQH